MVGSSRQHQKRRHRSLDDARLVLVGDHTDRLYDEHFDVLQRNGYDPAAAGAWLLGSRMPGSLDAEGVAVLREIVDDDDAVRRLAHDAGGPHSRAALDLVQAMASAIGGSDRIA